MPDGSFGNTIKPEETATENAEQKSSKRRGPREVSTIAFPYHTLADAIAVAQAILDRGAVPMARDQLAPALSQQVGSGAFTNKIAAARMFGLIQTVAGKYELTRLGHEIVDSDVARQKTARAQAFLNVPLYRRAYDNFRNDRLPPRPHGLENALVSFGVSAKQKDKARRAFDTSARLAGYFDHGNDKLVAPVIVPNLDKEEPSRKSDLHGGRPRADEHDGEDSVDNHFIKGLLDELPMKVGGKWSHAERVKWLQLAAQCADMLYAADDSDDGATIKITLVYNKPRRGKKSQQVT
jgi:hypothetical protein